MTDLILKAISGLVKIGISAAEDAQKREAEQLLELQKFYDKGAEETAALIADMRAQSAETDAAFAAARKRLGLPDEETTKP